MNRRHRLRGGQAFSAVRARRATGSMALLRVALAPNAERRARAGFVVPRRAGDAVTRNRVRRRLRALVQSRLGELSGLDVVVGAGAEAATARWAALSDEFNTCLMRARGRLAAGPSGSR